MSLKKQTKQKGYSIIMNIKKVLKKLTAVICCAGCLFSYSTDVYGMETEKIEVTQEIKDGITACLETENGEVLPMDCDISLVKHTLNTRSSEGDMYTLEVKSSERKTSSDSTTQFGIGLTGRITWIDHLGTSNELVSYTGTYSNPSQIAFAKYDVGLANSTKHSITIDNIAANNSIYNTDPCHNKGVSFFLYMYARTKEGSIARLTVKTSIFD